MAVPHACRCLAAAVCQRIGLHDNVANAATTTARCLLQLVTQYTGILFFLFRLQFCFVSFFSFQLSSSLRSRSIADAIADAAAAHHVTQSDGHVIERYVMLWGRSSEEDGSRQNRTPPLAASAEGAFITMLYHVRVNGVLNTVAYLIFLSFPTR